MKSGEFRFGLIASLADLCTQSGMITARSNSCTEIPRCSAAFSKRRKLSRPTDSINFDIVILLDQREPHKKSCLEPFSGGRSARDFVCPKSCPYYQSRVYPVWL